MINSKRGRKRNQEAPELSKRTLDLLDQAENARLRKSIVNLYRAAFALTLLFTLTIIVLKGGGYLEVTDEVVGSLLLYTVAHIPGMLGIIVASLFKSKRAK